MSKSISSEPSTTELATVESVIAPPSNVDLVASSPDADELVICKFCATTPSIVPWNSELAITEFWIVPWSIVVFVKMLLLPVPSEKSELRRDILFAELSLIIELVITMLFAVESIIEELLVTVSQIRPFAKREFVIVTLSKSVSRISPLEKSASTIVVLPEIAVSRIVPLEKSVVMITEFDISASSRTISSIVILVRIKPFAVPCSIATFAKLELST